ncbi:MAG: hypothetical protein PHY11_00715 [Bacilli bacterium]|nr:hypothetical protein [Bacilli bacterium]
MIQIYLFISQGYVSTSKYKSYDAASGDAIEVTSSTVPGTYSYTLSIEVDGKELSKTINVVIADPEAKVFVLSANAPSTSATYYDLSDATPAGAIANSTPYKKGVFLVEGTDYYQCISSYTSETTAVIASLDTEHWVKVSLSKALAANKKLLTTTPTLSSGNINEAVAVGKVYYNEEGVAYKVTEAIAATDNIMWNEFGYNAAIAGVAKYTAVSTFTTGGITSYNGKVYKLIKTGVSTAVVEEVPGSDATVWELATNSMKWSAAGVGEYDTATIDITTDTTKLDPSADLALNSYFFYKGVSYKVTTAIPTAGISIADLGDYAESLASNAKVAKATIAEAMESDANAKLYDMDATLATTDHIYLADTSSAESIGKISYQTLEATKDDGTKLFVTGKDSVYNIDVSDAEDVVSIIGDISIADMAAGTYNYSVNKSYPDSSKNIASSGTVKFAASNIHSNGYLGDAMVEVTEGALSFAAAWTLNETALDEGQYVFTYTIGSATKTITINVGDYKSKLLVDSVAVGSTKLETVGEHYFYSISSDSTPKSALDAKVYFKASNIEAGTELCALKGTVAEGDNIATAVTAGTLTKVVFEDGLFAYTIADMIQPLAADAEDTWLNTYVVYTRDSSDASVIKEIVGISEVEVIINGANFGKDGKFA